MPEKTWGGWHFDSPQPETCKDQNARENLGRLAFGFSATGNLQGSKCQRKLGAAGILIFRNRKPARIKMPEKTCGGWHLDFPQPETCKDQNARENLGRLAF